MQCTPCFYCFPFQFREQDYGIDYNSSVSLLTHSLNNLAWSCFVFCFGQFMFCLNSRRNIVLQGYTENHACSPILVVFVLKRGKKITD